MNRAISIGTLAFVILFALAACSGGGSSGDSEDGDASPVSIPSSITQNCIGFLVGGAGEISAVSGIGGAWARPHAGPFVWDSIESSNDSFDYNDTDETVTAAQESSVALLGTIWPFASWDQESCHTSEDCEVSTSDQFYPSKGGGGIPSYRCAPCSYNDYQDFLAQLVERYDGDGTNDMSGLTLPVKYWEILNEPAMDSDDLTFYKGTKAEYVTILQKSYEAIKNACSDCSVVQGGAMGNQSTTLAYWGDIFELGGGSYFDIANIHYISSGDLTTLNVSDFKDLMQGKGLSKTIWVTEAEFSSESEVEAAVEGAINAGASRIFFTSFEIGEGYAFEGEYSEVYEDITNKCP